MTPKATEAMEHMNLQGYCNTRSGGYRGVLRLEVSIPLFGRVDLAGLRVGWT